MTNLFHSPPPDGINCRFLRRLRQRQRILHRLAATSLFLRLRVHDRHTVRDGQRRGQLVHRLRRLFGIVVAFVRDIERWRRRNSRFDVPPSRPFRRRRPHRRRSVDHRRAGGFGLQRSRALDDVRQPCGRRHAAGPPNQQTGRAEWYENYRIEVADVVRDGSFRRPD